MLLLANYWIFRGPIGLLQYSAGQLAFLPEHLRVAYFLLKYRKMLRENVLCLAVVGGQQSVVFGLLGARVTVVGFLGQLGGDRKATKHYGYEIKTVHSDMFDLSDLKEAPFDLVFQVDSMAYVP